MAKAKMKCPECNVPDEPDCEIQCRGEEITEIHCQCLECGHEWYEEWKFLQEL